MRPRQDRSPSFSRKRAKGGKQRKATKSSAQTHSPGRRDRHKTDVRHEEEDLSAARTATQSALHDWLAQANRMSQLQRKREATRDTTQHLDPWQREALEALLRGEHVVVDAPTTAGKTRIVTAFFALKLKQSGFRAAYTSPVKSLSFDKLKEFRQEFGNDQVGISTGDFKDKLDAPLVIATLESYRNSLFGVAPDLGRNLEVFDEYHFLQDIGRGSAREEAIILTPPHCQLLLLSASVANSDQFAAWIQTITQVPCRLIRSVERPVPLVSLIFYREEWLLLDAVRLSLPEPDRRHKPYPLELEEVARRMKDLPQLGLTPCIAYAGTRLACEHLARVLCKQLKPIPSHDAEKIKTVLESKDDIEDLSRFFHTDLRRMLLVYGVAYHHSGLAHYARRAIEQLLKAGHLRFCVATMGLSVGINFSVRSALIADATRPGDQGITVYPPSEVLQMLGRAGRRGRDAVGFSLWTSVASYHQLGGAQREVCESHLKHDPASFLGLVGRGLHLAGIEQVYRRSFMHYSHPEQSFVLLCAERLTQALERDRLPCGRSPAAAYQRYQSNDVRSPCSSCSERERCHRLIAVDYRNSLADLHGHLHQLGCLDADESLPDYGSIARYFPQSGGLVIAYLIAHHYLTRDGLMAGLELMGAFCLPYYKTPEGCPPYSLPFPELDVEANLRNFYPQELFADLYDIPLARGENTARAIPGKEVPARQEPRFRDFNPVGGLLLREWVRGDSWPSLTRQFTSEKFGQGDLMAVIYRAATYLQSLAQAHLPELSPAAASLRDILLRPPVLPPL